MGSSAVGRITGEIKVNGFKQDLQTFKRVSGYCEQFDIHSPQTTVIEALWFSASLRLSPTVDSSTRSAFVQEVGQQYPKWNPADLMRKCES